MKYVIKFSRKRLAAKARVSEIIGPFDNFLEAGDYATRLAKVWDRQAPKYLIDPIYSPSDAPSAPSA